MSKTIYTLSPNDTDHVFAGAVAASSGRTASKAPSLSAVSEVLKKDKDAVAILNSVTGADRDAFEKHFSASDRARVHVLCPTIKDVSAINGEQRSAPVAGYISREWLSPERAGQQYARVFRVVDQGQGGIWSESAKSSRESLRLESSLQKGWAASGLSTHLNGFGYRKQLCSKIASAADELIMNAIFDAPVNPDGKARYVCPSDSEVILAGKDRVEVAFAQDLPLFQLVVSDLHGTLDPAIIFKHVGKAFDASLNNLPDGDFRPGLGIAWLVRSGASLLFFSQPGIRTDVCAYFNVPEKAATQDDSFQFVATICPTP